MTEIQNSKQKNQSLKRLVTRSAGAFAACWNLFGICLPAIFLAGCLVLGIFMIFIKQQIFVNPGNYLFK